MRIRRAVASDFPTAASISVAAFAKDELYQYRYPYAGQQQSSFREFFLRRLKLRNVLPGYIIWVAIANESQDLKDGVPDQALGSETGRTSEDPGETVIGYAVWCRHGQSAEARSWQTQSWVDCKTEPGAGIAQSLSSLTWQVLRARMHALEDAGHLC